MRVVHALSLQWHAGTASKTVTRQRALKSKAVCAVDEGNMRCGHEFLAIGQAGRPVFAYSIEWSSQFCRLSIVARVTI